MAIVANTALTNTFDTWRTNTNTIAHRINAFATTESTLFANTLFANTGFTTKNTVANTNIFSAHMNVTANTNLKGATVTFPGASVSFSGANTVFSGHVNFSGNTNLVGLNTSQKQLANSINEVLTTALAANTAAATSSSDALAFAIALG